MVMCVWERINSIPPVFVQIAVAVTTSCSHSQCGSKCLMDHCYEHESQFVQPAFVSIYTRFHFRQPDRLYFTTLSGHEKYKTLCFDHHVFPPRFFLCIVTDLVILWSFAFMFSPYNKTMMYLFV